MALAPSVLPRRNSTPIVNASWYRSIRDVKPVSIRCRVSSSNSLAVKKWLSRISNAPSPMKLLAERGREKAAGQIIRGLGKNRREILVGSSELLMLKIRKYLPSLFFRIAGKIKPM